MTRRFVRRPLAALGACLVGGIAAAGIVGCPPVAATPRVGPDAVRITAAGAADEQSHDEATAGLRDYLRTHPQQYNDLRGIMAPL